jgi:hypothetical protein
VPPSFEDDAYADRLSVIANVHEAVRVVQLHGGLAESIGVQVNRGGPGTSDTVEKGCHESATDTAAAVLRLHADRENWLVAGHWVLSARDTEYRTRAVGGDLSAIARREGCWCLPLTNQ